MSAMAYEYRHVVTFEETNLFGNAYYVHYVKWQGICRELFLRDHAPGVLDELQTGLVLSTVRCSCRYGAELRAFDTVVLRMSLASTVWNRIVLRFDYFRELGDRLEPVASGEQEIACMERREGRAVEREIPGPLLEALERYRAGAGGEGGSLL
jgi:enediyne biosynthesis thioesterase